MSKTTLLTALFASSLFAVACDDESRTTGRVQLALTDAPGDGIQAAFVVISEIYLQGEGGRVVLRDAPITVDLLTLANSTRTIVDAEVPDGVYGELRFVIDGAWVEVEAEGGVEVYATPGFEAQAGGDIAGELKTPSWSASGLKIKLPDGRLIVDGAQQILVVDFDVAESFRTETGNGAWVMSPVVAANQLDLTTSIAVSAHLGADVALNSPIYVELVDREGFSEGRLELVDPDGDGTLQATFVFVDPSEGPFTAQVVTADGLVVTTSPAVATIEGASGLTVGADLDVVAVIVP